MTSRYSPHLSKAEKAALRHDEYLKRKALHPEQFPRSVIGSGQGKATIHMDYSPEQTEFMLALQKYKEINRKPFPTCCEILEVLIKLGYRKQ